MTGFKSLRQFQFLIAVFVVTMFATIGVSAAPRCELLFQTHEPLAVLASQLSSLAPGQRREFADPLFTEQSSMLLKGERIAISKIKGLTASKRGAIGYVRRHLDKLSEIAQRDIQLHGDVTEDTLVRIGFHLGNLNFYLLHPGNVRQSQLWASADDFRIIDARFYAHSKVLNEGFLFFPTKNEVSIEELTTWLANDVAPIGVIRKPIKADGTGFEPDGFYAHDLNHAEFYISVLRRIAKQRDPRSDGDLEKSPSVHLVKRRFRWLTERLKDLPPYERKAGFTVLFYLTHEQPGLGFLDVLARKRGALKFDLPKEHADALRLRLNRKNDLASDVPRRYLFRKKKDALRFADAGERVLRDLLADDQIANF